MKQIAVEWLENELKNSKYFYKLMEDINSRSTIAKINIFEQAKQMEKEQQGYSEKEVIELLTENLKRNNMNIREQLIEELDTDETLTFADGFDNAILGVLYEKSIVVYSYKKAIEILCEDMTEEDAVEYLSFNTLCIQGDNMPVWVMDYYG